MKKTTNAFLDAPRSISEIQRIKFDLNPSNYKCFISNNDKLHQQCNAAIPDHDAINNSENNIQQTQKKRISDLKIPYIRRNNLANSCRQSQKFNTQVLLMQYNKNEVYTDSIKNGSEKQAEFDTKSVNSQISEESEIVKSCLKMLGDQTDTDSSSQSRYYPMQQISFFNNNVSVYYPNYRNQNPEINTFAIELPKIVFDGRTTIMIRNIPNKYTENLLLDLFYKNHQNKIDFFYLPIDPKNNCNVGYAFLNFIHPNFIEEFYNQFHNKKWKLFNSEKICHICYARIQGTTQLSHHFYSANKKARDSIK